MGACASPSADDLAALELSLAVEGPWRIDSETSELGDAQYVAYEGAGPFLGEEGCAGGLSSGTRLVGDFLAQRFTQVSRVGGYSCRPIRGGSGTMSLHGAGRALDLHIPTLGDDAEADNELGDAVGAFLIEHAELFGVQLIIWDEWSWGASRMVGEKGRLYTGVNPHHDHLHVELSVEAASREEDWFSAWLPMAPAFDASVADASPTLPAVDGGVAHETPSSDDAGVRQPSLPVFEPKPVIDPDILDDDPLQQDELGGQTRDNAKIRGSTCATSPAIDRGCSLLTSALLGVVLLRRRGAVRAWLYRGSTRRNTHE
jgi:hypothetical protein